MNRNTSGGSNYNKWLFIILAIILGGISIYLVIGSNTTNDILSKYNNLSNGGRAGITPQLQFLRIYTMATGDTTLALRAGLSEEEVTELVETGQLNSGNIGSNSLATAWDSSNHNHYAIKQSNYPSVKLGPQPDGNVSGNGCGLCSLIAATAELADVTYTPADFKTSFPVTIDVGWDYGNSYGFYAAGVSQFAKDATASTNIPGTYSTFGYIEGNKKDDDTTIKILSKIIDYCGDENTVAIISTCGDSKERNTVAKNSNGLFTGGGHIICVTDIVVDNNGNTYMHLSDSSTVASTNLGKDWNSMSNLNIPIKDSNGNYIVTAMGKDASGNPMEKHYWIKWAVFLKRTS